MKKKFIPAIHGLKLAIEDKSIRIQIILGILTLIVSYIIRVNEIEFLFILSAIALVIVNETVNTCIERLCDFCTTERNEKIKYIKDLSAAAVLMSSIYALIIGIVILWNHIGGLL
jgi:diacylglycerol kinase